MAAHFILAVSALLGSVHAAEISVSPGAGTLEDAMNTAQDGDILTLQAGNYGIKSAPLRITKPGITIRGNKGNGTDVSIIQIQDAHNVPYAIEANTWNVIFQDIALQYFMSTTFCTLVAESQASNGNSTQNSTFGVWVAAPEMNSEMLELQADLGEWQSGRRLTDMNLGSCSPKSDLGGPISNIFLRLRTIDCHAEAGYSVSLDSIGSCGVRPQKNGSNVEYSARVVAKYADGAVEKSDGQISANEGSASADLRIQLDQKRSITTTASVTHPRFEISLNGIVVTPQPDRTTLVSVNMSNPNGVEIPETAEGPISVRDRDQKIYAAHWNVLPSLCINATPSSPCWQVITFLVSGCDLTAKYDVSGIPLICQSNDTECASAAQEPITLRLYLDSLDICQMMSRNISDYVIGEANIFTNETYAVESATSSVNLGSISYWSVALNSKETTNTSPNFPKIHVTDAEILHVTRRMIEGQCPSLADMNAVFDVAESDQKFIPANSQSPPCVNFSLPITARLACYNPDIPSSMIELQFSVRVDYAIDQLTDQPEGANKTNAPMGGRRRRRAVSGLSLKWRRSVGVVEAKKSMTVAKPDGGDDMIHAGGVDTRPADHSGPSAGGVILLVSGFTFLILCCCCCTFMVVIVVRRRHRRRLRKEEINLQRSVIGNSEMPYNPSSQVNLNMHGMSQMCGDDIPVGAVIQDGNTGNLNSSNPRRGSKPGRRKSMTSGDGDDISISSMDAPLVPENGKKKPGKRAKAGASSQMDTASESTSRMSTSAFLLVRKESVGV